MIEALRDAHVVAMAREAGTPVTARGGRTSQGGQTINRGVVVDFSRHLNGRITLPASHQPPNKPINHNAAPPAPICTARRLRAERSALMSRPTSTPVL